jgi:hypothetical protein
MPKSISLMPPSKVNTRFWGETSRCTMCIGVPSSEVAWWAWCSAEHRLVMMVRVAASGIARSRSRAACHTVRRSTPWRYSIARYGTSPANPKSYMRTMLS